MLNSKEDVSYCYRGAIIRKTDKFLTFSDSAGGGGTPDSASGSEGHTTTGGKQPAGFQGLVNGGDDSSLIFN